MKIRLPKVLKTIALIALIVKHFSYNLFDKIPFKIILFLFFLTAYYFGNSATPPIKKSSENRSGISAYFTPTPAPVNNIFNTSLPKKAPSSAYREVIQTLLGAQKNIYLMVYEYNIFHLNKILISKLKAGVKVSLLIEADNLKLPQTYFLLNQLNQAGARIILDNKKSGIMHNKFVVVDEQIVITGSANYSVNAFFQQFNDVVIIDNPTLAKKYLERFIQLSELNFRKFKSRPSWEPITIPDQYNPNITYQVVFSRSVFDPTAIMVTTINTCKKSVHFLIFAFSSKPISQAMKKCLKKKSTVRGIFDNAFESENITKNWGSVPFQSLWKAGADVKYDNLKEKIHHKNLIINSDTVITGSFNFSANAQKNNDENYLIVHSSSLANQYLTHFEKLWQKFPSETLFEQYIKDRNRKKTKLSFQKYKKKYFKTKFSIINKELTGEKFEGKAVLVETGQTVMVELPKSKRRITVTLAGIMAPVSENHEWHQEPQAHMAKEALIFLVAQKLVTGKIITRNEFHIHAILQVKGEKHHSVNAALLEQGMVYPLWYEKSIYKQQPPPLLSYKKNPVWLKALPHLKNAYKKGYSQKRVLWGELPLKLSPFEFTQKVDEAKLKKRLLEDQHSVSHFSKKFWIGNRKTLKAYPPKSPTYMEYLKDLKDKKLIFFKTRKDAKAAGYLIMNEKNY